MASPLVVEGLPGSQLGRRARVVMSGRLISASPSSAVATNAASPLESMGRAESRALLRALLLSGWGVDAPLLQRCAHCGGEDHGAWLPIEWPGGSLRLSSSRSSGLVLAGISDSPIGLDAERIDAFDEPAFALDPESFPLAHAEEGGASLGQRWACLEAVIKLSGEGLAGARHVRWSRPHAGAPAHARSVSVVTAAWASGTATVVSWCSADRAIAVASAAEVVEIEAPDGFEPR
jgi:hypothetical protein